MSENRELFHSILLLVSPPTHEWRKEKGKRHTRRCHPLFSLSLLLPNLLESRDRGIEKGDRKRRAREKGAFSIFYLSLPFFLAFRQVGNDREGRKRREAESDERSR